MKFFEGLGQGGSLFFLITLGFVLLMTITAVVVLLLDRRNKKEEKQINQLYNEPEKQDDVVETVKEEEKKRAQLELEEMMKQIEADLEGKVNEAVSTYEQEQEEKAIISYQELLEATKKSEQQLVENEQLEINLDEVTPSNELEDILEQITKEPNEQLEPKKPVPLRSIFEEGNHRFQNTEFISPVFGKVENNISYPKIEEFSSTKKNKEDFSKEEEYPTREQKHEYVLEYDDPLDRTINLQPLTEEIKKNEDFLEALKEFRKNL